ncbi:MAG: hypothetical protein JWQ30_428 [Sediminibacterium sp.]|nr:hypothetical protein [Sediminibacterium sp.]
MTRIKRIFTDKANKIRKEPLHPRYPCAILRLDFNQ